MRHCFKEYVVNLTNMSAAHGRTSYSEGVECCSTPSSVCTHSCLSGSCDQYSGHKKMGTLLNSPVSGLLGSLQEVACKGQDTSDGDSYHTCKRHVNSHSRTTVVVYMLIQPCSPAQHKHTGTKRV